MTNNPKIPHDIEYRWSVVRAGSKGGYPYYAAKLYQAKYRKDGIITYRLVRQLTEPFRSYEKAKAMGEKQNIGVKFDKDVKSGKAVYLQRS